MSWLTRVSHFIGRSFAYWTLAFALAGFLYPDLFIGLKSQVSYLLGVIMFGMGLTLKVSDFSEVFKRPKQVVMGILAQFIIMPVLALLLTIVFKLDPMLAVGVLLVGCCPGGTSSNVITYLSKGDLALSVTITSISTLLAPIMTPFLLQLLANKIIDIAFWPMMMSIVYVVIVPIVLGVAFRVLVGKKATVINPILPIISVAGIVTIVAIVVAINQTKIREVGLLVICIVALHNVLGYAIGYALAHYLGMQWPQRKAIAIEVGMQNSGLGASLAIAHFSPLAAVPSALFSVWHNISGALLANFFQKMPRVTEDNHPVAAQINQVENT